MSKNWRPEGYKNPFNPAAISVRDRNGKPISHYEACEAGADAMLGALDSVQDYIRYDNSGMTTFNVVVKKLGSREGKWVFIPDRNKENGV